MTKTPFAILATILAIFILRTPARAAVEIPFQFNDGFICVQARVTKSGEPLNLLLDSGAGISVLSLRAAKRLKVKLGATQSVRGVGSEAMAYDIEPVRSAAGAAALPPIPMAVDLSMADELCSTPIDGLIGVDFFQDRVVQIDYARRCLRLLGAADGMPSGSAERLPIQIRNGVMCVPVGVNDSRPRWTRFDTGCNDPLHWVIPRQKISRGRAGVSIGFVTDLKDTSLTSVTLGSAAMERVKTSLHARPLFEGEAGLLGNGLLSRFTVTVDWPKKQVFLASSDR